MVTTSEVEVLIAALEESVEKALHYFEGSGATSQVRVHQWGVRDVLSHFAFWHAGTAQGMESVAGEGAPFHADAPVDETNAREISNRAGHDFPQLIQEIRGLQERLAKAARGLADLDQTVLVFQIGTGDRYEEWMRMYGTEISARRRLELIANHFRTHIEALQTAAGS